MAFVTAKRLRDRIPTLWRLALRPLRVELNIGDQEISRFEWIEEGKANREWLIPARLINEIANRVVVELEN
jgi:hypothetical protein